MSHTQTEISQLNTEQKRALVERLLRAKTGGQSAWGLALLPGLFEAQADRRPDAVAVQFEDATISYGELDRRANQLAHLLRRLGVGPEVRVGVHLERSIAMVVGLLAVLKAGGAYVPLDPDFPADRLRLMIDDSRLPLVLTQERLRDTLPANEAIVVCVDSDRDSFVLQSTQRLPGRIAPENLAYVIYTSGSTGRPKGVQVTHRALANFLESMHALLGMDDRDELLSVTTLSFDIAALELYLPLVVGARLALVGRDVAGDGARLAHRLAESAVTFLQATPATWRLLLEAGWPGSPGLKILCGGEALTRALADRLLERGGRVWNLYGPTETTIWSSAEPVTPGAGPVLIGRPIARTQMHVLDARLRQVPLGVLGELYIGGVGVARGYLGRPGLTAERFVPDPFGSEPGGRLYRTGDLARWHADGRLECLGRLDHQVKIRGHRIELGEIEATLARHPAVRGAAVLAREDSPGDRRLVAYLTFRQDPPPTPAELRSWLRRTLPEYMVPAVHVTLDSLPLTPNGKIDRNALPAPDPGRLAPEQSSVPPRGPIEEAVAEVCAQVLRRPRPGIGAYDSFFELGGHSLLATQFLSRLRDLFGVEVSLRSLFEDPTVAGIAGRIEDGKRAGAEPGIPPLLPAERSAGSEIPLSFAQQSLWFLDQLSPGQATFNMSVAVRAAGPLDRGAFERALAAMIRRHESLRTRFASVDGRPVQVVAEAVPLPLGHVDLRSLEGPQREAEARRLAAAEARRPFDLSLGPLIRVLVVQLGDDDHAVLLTMHHIIGDGWSLGVAAGELAALYHAFRRGAPAPLGPLPIQYADYALWQRSWLQGALRDRLVEYWSRRLAGVVPLELPTDRPRPPIRSPLGALHPFVVPMSVAEPLAALCRREGVTPFMLLLGAFQTLLHRYTGQDDIVVGSPVANRTRSEVEGLIGYFVNMLALRTDLAGDPTFRALLGRVREVALGAYEHQDLPFEMVVEALHPPRDASRTPFFQVMFVLQNNRLPHVAHSDLTVTPLALETGTGTAKFDLTLVLEETDNGLSGSLEYSTDLFDGATIDRMIGHFQTLLESIAADPSRRLSELPWLDAGERQLVLESWSTAPVSELEVEPLPSPGAAESAIHERFEAQVERTPDAVALVFGAERVTYRILNDRANRLAHRLAALGVGPETVVGICATRSPAMLAGLLGVLKAGGAYMPLDPDAPGERLALLLAEAEVRVVLTHDHLRHQLAGVAATLVSLDDAEAGAGEETANPSSGAAPANLAYVIYTSGSTGRPKGVMIEHASLLDAARAWELSYTLRPGLRHLQAAGFGFDVFTGDWVAR